MTCEHLIFLDDTSAVDMTAKVLIEQGKRRTLLFLVSPFGARSGRDILKV